MGLIVAAVNPALPGQASGRLTYTSGDPLPSADELAKLVAYFTPFRGDWLPVYDGVAWYNYNFAELSIKLTDTAQTATTVINTAVLTLLTSTAQLVRGMAVTGTGIAANSTISTIDSATQVTLNNNATANGTAVAMTFKCPASKVYDVFGVPASGALALRFGNAWTNDSTRADAITLQNGAWVNNAAINAADSNTIAAKVGRLIGTVRTTTTAGQGESSDANRYMANVLNPVQTTLKAILNYTDDNSATTISTTSTVVAAVNGGTADQCNFLVPVTGWPVAEYLANFLAIPAALKSAYGGIGVDSTTTAVKVAGSDAAGATLTGRLETSLGVRRRFNAVGVHYFAVLGWTDGGTCVFYTDSARFSGATDPVATGGEGSVWT